MSRSGRRTWAFRLAAVLAASTITLLVWEVANRLIPSDALSHNPWYVWAPGGTATSDDLMFERPPHLRWEGLSNGDIGEGRGARYATPVTFNTDYQGFRNEADIERAPIVFIGDSYTEAGNVPVEDVFSQQVERALGVRTRNLGRAHHAPSQELIILRKFGLAMEPNVVVWQFCETNDLTDEKRFQAWIRNGRPRATGFSNRQEERAWEQRSPTMRLVKLVESWRSPDWPLRGEFSSSAGVVPMRFLYLPSREQVPRGHAGWGSIASALREGAALLDGLGIQLIVVAVPMKIRVIGPYVEPAPSLIGELEQQSFHEKVGRGGRFAAAHPGTALPWDVAESQTFAARLAKLAEELGVPFVDTLPALRELAASGELVYQPHETHISAIGHRAVAGALLDHPSGVLRGAEATD